MSFTTGMSAVSAEQAAPPEVLASDLCWLLGRANQLLNAEFSTALEASGISPRQHSVLATALTGEHTQTDLARIVGLDKTTMMVTLDELERSGLAERRPLPSDRRARIVAVTPDGQRKVQEAEEVLDRVRGEVLSILPADQRQIFLQSLGQLACTQRSATGDCAGPQI
ncbi:MAG: MarR family winged helix-turn-helix transcriptional regulator [Solirubrobacteraceae bacterium]